jgi:hypothetical protein
MREREVGHVTRLVTDARELVDERQAERHVPLLSVRADDRLLPARAVRDPFLIGDTERVE